MSRHVLPVRKPSPYLLLPLVVLMSGPASLGAQSAQIQVLGGEVLDERGGAVRGITVAPSVAWTGSPGRLRLDGRATALEGGGRVIGAGGAFHLVLGRLGPVEVGSSGNVGVLAAGPGLRTLVAELAPGIRIVGGRGSLGAGFGVRGASLRSASGAHWRDLPLGDQRRDETALAPGVWAEAGMAVGALGLSVFAREFRGEDAGWREAQAAASLHLGRVGLSGFVGARAGAAEARWAGASASLRVAPGVELIGQLARQPSDPLTGLSGGRTAAVGVRLTRAFGRVGAAEPTAVRLALRAEPGARVELLGDWNGWQPERVPHRGGGVYDVELHLPPGIHEFVFRVDGELRVPEGYETVPDDFGGRSAVVRVRG